MISEKQKLHIAKLAKLNKGRTLSAETKKKISLANKKSYTPERRLKISLRRKKSLGTLASNWKGGKMLVGGYWYVYSPNHPHKTKNKYVCEHRLIMEKKLKRYLDPSEIVHHINGIKTDNRIKNLVVCQSNGVHSSIHDKHRLRKPNGQFANV